MTAKTLLVELFVEELPPKALKKLGEAFAGVLFEQLAAQGLTVPDAGFTPFATPRRLAVLARGVLERAPDRAVQHKLMPVAVGLDAQGQPTPALRKKLAALGLDESVLPRLQRVPDGKAELLLHDSVAPGTILADGLQKALDEAIAKLPIPKVMTYQLESDCELPGWSSVRFVRPAHGLVALWGEQVVPVHALGLHAGRVSHGHRFEAAQEPLVLADADGYAAALELDGAVIASFAARKDEIARQLAAAAARVGGGEDGESRGALRPIDDDALLDEVTALVERPNVLVCEFEREFLAVPQECLILTMKANQKYFPLLDAQDKLTNKFLVVSNIRPADASAVIGGNERVVRPRLADAKFFFDQDRRKPLESRVPGLAKVVYHNRLGSQGERVERVRAIAAAIARQLGGDAAFAAQVDQAARLAKADLLTDMVGEFPELQGTMGRYYALADGLPGPVADAIEDHYRPRFAGDDLPRGPVGVAVALADKLETLVGMFGIGNLPTGDKDPFALRRHALGVLRMLVERELPLDLDALLHDANAVFGDKVHDACAQLCDFIYDRFAGTLREQGYSAQEVDAVLALRPQRLADVARRLAAVRAFAALPEAAALVAANKRVANILKKAGDVDAHVSEVLLHEPAEKALYAALRATAPPALAQFEAGDYTAALRTLAALRAPVDAFFDAVMVNVEQADLRLNRQGLLKTLHDAMNRVADLSRLAA
ncbi:glycine--tRNA ligase subunit beta [Ramlibacter sp. H39-3-26]|uniref:glycine--tRNA ligase subunit beta n=1 Tax=Curvibacter soli TaxID=3031331 RepID=UPI0023DC2213|nr:glycine--tRNA ligase subunit beta [Ramlibacter sp. H39-3-26]MDF1486428.1 glycine--tRNA ligase subunit beta [Ramlibacter sp. H39-3-26]